MINKFFKIILTMIIFLFFNSPAITSNSDNYFSLIEFINAQENPKHDSPRKPNVLIIGDSISGNRKIIGYSQYLRYLLRHTHDVYKYTNDESTKVGLEKVKIYLPRKKWDIIIFNFGLHDLYLMQDGKERVSLYQYENNLIRIIDILKVSDAKLIWISTTPVPKGVKNRIQNAQKPYNLIAKRLMKNEMITTCDLENALTHEKLHKFQNPKDVHFNKLGSAFIAKFIYDCINLN